MQIFILGMHRSGTSAVTGLITMMGAFFGDENQSIGANEQNPKGFFERRDVIDLHDELLAASGAAWDRPLPFDATQVSAEIRRSFTEKLQPILMDLNQRPTWVVKDPRLCLTVSLWKPLVATPLAILVHRNPVEVATSLSHRNDVPLGYAIALWEHYTLECLRAVRDMPTIVVSYNQLLLNPETRIADLEQRIRSQGADLQVPWERMRELIDTELYRNRATTVPLEEVLNERQLQLCRLLDSYDLRSLDRLPDLSYGARKALQEYEAEFKLMRAKLPVDPNRRNVSPRYLRLEEKLRDHAAGTERLKQKYEAQTESYNRLRAKLDETVSAYTHAKEKRVVAENAYRRAKERFHSVAKENEELKQRLGSQTDKST